MCQNLLCGQCSSPPHTRSPCPTRSHHRMPLDALRPTSPRTLPPHHGLALSLSRPDSSPSFCTTMVNAGLAEPAHINARRRTLTHHHEHPPSGMATSARHSCPLRQKGLGPISVVWVEHAQDEALRERARRGPHCGLARAAWRGRASRLRLCAGRSDPRQQSRRSQRLRLPMREALPPCTPCCRGASRARLSALSPSQSAGSSSGACAPRA